MTTRYLLDTNAFSLLLQKTGEDAARAYLTQLPHEQFFVSVITLGETQRGITMLPLGKRRLELENWFLRMQGIFPRRILDINQSTALIWGELSGRMRMIGQNIEHSDLLIAATALEHDLTVVTRNVSDFTPTGVSLLDPWNPPANPAESADSTAGDAS